MTIPENVRAAVTAKEASLEGCIPDLKDKVSWYAYRHNELLGYLQSALAISQPQRHEDALKVIQKKCEEDQFDIVLLGEFQSGKSTTLDVLCGGRELSPQGRGQKSTSAVPVSIEVARPDHKPEGWSGDEWAELRFKDDAQIKNEILDTFESYLADSESNIADALKPFAQEERSLRENFMAKFDLQNGEHWALFRRVVEADWAVYGRDHGALTSEHRQRLEVLSIYLKFYGTPEYQSQIAKPVVSVDEAGNRLLFPRNWQGGRAPTSLDFDLTFDECVFAFLDAAILHIQSSVLSRLNCRVTDCPGLDASAYDTSVARRALFRADGVWFVKECNKQIAEKDLGVLFDLVKGSGCLERTGMALNLFPLLASSDSDESMHLVDYCKGQLDREGYKFPVFWCNARFAYLASLARRKIEKNVSFTGDERTRLLKIVRERERNPSLNDAALWVAAVNEAGRKSEVPEVEDIENLDMNAVELLWNHSNMDTAVDTMAKIVLDQKGLSILVDKGSKKALEILRCYEHEVQLAEDMATCDAEKVKKELSRARECMNAFVSGARNVKTDSPLWKERGYVLNQMASALVEFIFDDTFCDQYALRAAREIYHLNREFHWTHKGFDAAFSDANRTIVLDLISNGYGRFVAEEWRSDSKVPAVREFYRQGENVNGALLDLSKMLEKDGGPFASGLPIPKLGDFLMGGEDCVKEFDDMTRSLAEALRQGFWGDLWSGLKGILSLGQFWKDDSVKEEEGVEKLRKDLRPKIVDALNNRVLINKFRASVMPAFAPTIDSALSFFDESIKDMRNRFDTRCAELEEINNAAAEKKQAIAEENKKIRTEQIQPLRERLEVFEKDVQAELWEMMRHG